MDKLFRILIFIYFSFSLSITYCADEPGLTQLYEHNITELIHDHCGGLQENLTLSPQCLSKLLPFIREDIAMRLRYGSTGHHWLAGTDIYPKLFPEQSLFFEELVTELTTEVRDGDGKIHYPYMIQKRSNKFYFISMINTSRFINYEKFSLTDGAGAVPGKFRAMAESMLVYKLWAKRTEIGHDQYISEFQTDKVFTKFFLNVYFDFAKRYGHLFLFKGSLLSEQLSIFSFFEDRLSPSEKIRFRNLLPDDQITELNLLLTNTSVDPILAGVMRDYRAYLLLQGSAILSQLDFIPALYIKDTNEEPYQKFIEKFTEGESLSWVSLNGGDITTVDFTVGDNKYKVQGILAELLELEKTSHLKVFFEYNLFSSAFESDPFGRINVRDTQILVLKGYEYLLFHLYSINTINGSSLMSDDQNIFSNLSEEKQIRLRQLLEVFQKIYDPMNKLEGPFKENGFCGLRSLLPVTSLP